MAITGYNNLRQDPRLKRYVPRDFEHVEKHRLTATLLAEITTPVSVQNGVNWYSVFDSPVKKGGQWWAGLDSKNLGYLRGGHSTCMPKNPLVDYYSWYLFYNQYAEGACVGMATCRMMSQENRKLFNPWWQWDMAKSVDEWADTNPGDQEGTSVRASMDIARTRGLVPYTFRQKDLTVQQRSSLNPKPSEGIVANKWATTVDQLLEVLGNPLYKIKGAIPFNNSWGKEYPQLVWVPCETWDRLLREDGEFTMITDIK